MKISEIKQSLIKSGVKNLQEFGFPGASADNILTDAMYSEFFVSMLNDNLGHGTSIDNAINDLLLEIAKNKQT